MSFKNVLKNVAARGLKDITDMSVIKSYMDWREIKKNGLTIDADSIPSFAEQIVYRRGRCPECVEAGECVICHCEVDGKMGTPLSSCSGGRWDKMLTPEDWEDYKKENNITISVFQPNG